MATTALQAERFEIPDDIEVMPHDILAAPPVKTPQFSPSAFFSALLKQVYIDQPYIPVTILVPVDFEDRAALAELLSDKKGRKVFGQSGI